MGEPPDYYYVAQAADVLNCSFMELDEHPNKRKLMSIAFTVKRGSNNGEYDRELNPVYQEKLAEARKELSKLRG